MRDIKFRGRRVDNGEWVIGNLIRKKDPQYVEDVTWCYLIHDGALTAHEVATETAGEFTGLNDKNGREIYEGDIYKRILDKKNKFSKEYEWADYWLIEWLEKSACFTTTCIGNEGETGFVKSKNIKRNDFSKRFNEMDTYIGNIHENPELI